MDRIWMNGLDHSIEAISVQSPLARLLSIFYFFNTPKLSKRWESARGGERSGSRNSSCMASFAMKSTFYRSSLPRIVSEQKKSPEPEQARVGRREVVLRSSEMAMIAAIFHFSGTKPSYLGVQKNPPSLALCPATNNCISTSEEISDLTHYAPPWNYNPEDGRGKNKPVSKDEAVAELLQAIKSTRPDNFTPHVVEKTDDYIRVEYESPIMGFVDDVEFWFPPGKKSIVEYRSASRLGNYDFDINKKRIKALRLQLEKIGWASESSY